MAIFNNKNGDPSEREDDFRFFSQSDADYKISTSRKPIVVKKDKKYEFFCVKKPRRFVAPR